LHTIYTAATPENSKLTFFERLDREIDRVQAVYPDALSVGLADGAKDNWSYLEWKTQRQVADFWHVTQYVWSAAEDLFAADGGGMREWVEDWCRRLKHEPGAAPALIADLEARGQAPDRKRLPAKLEGVDLLPGPGAGGSDGLCGPGRAPHPDRLGDRRGGVPGPGEAAAVRRGDAFGRGAVRRRC
jgi:hypothetical protein